MEIIKWLSKVTTSLVELGLEQFGLGNSQHLAVGTVVLLGKRGSERLNNLLEVTQLGDC